MNRGSPIRQHDLYPLRLGFNEAPIHESGKYQAGAGQIPLRFRFNEAPIHESGKYERLGAASIGNAKASMRPRFMNRGSGVEQREVGAGRGASMRPRFMNRGSGSLPWLR